MAAAPTGANMAAAPTGANMAAAPTGANMAAALTGANMAAALTGTVPKTTPLNLWIFLTENPAVVIRWFRWL
ncbi:unnamed protein product [Boreogadus saida]